MEKQSQTIYYTILPQSPIGDSSLQREPWVLAQSVIGLIAEFFKHAEPEFFEEAPLERSCQR